MEEGARQAVRNFEIMSFAKYGMCAECTQWQLYGDGSQRMCFCMNEVRFDYLSGLIEAVFSWFVRAVFEEYCCLVLLLEPTTKKNDFIRPDAYQNLKHSV